MAASTIVVTKVILTDNFSGAVRRDITVEDIKTLGLVAAGHNAATAKKDVGLKIGVWNDGTAGVKGESILMYGKLVGGYATSAAGQPAVAKTITDVGEVSGLDADKISYGLGLTAIELSAFTADNYYGWFWVGGVAPVDFLGGAAGLFPATTTIPTDGTIVAGPLNVKVATAGTIIELTPMVTTVYPTGQALDADTA